MPLMYFLQMYILRTPGPASLFPGMQVDVRDRYFAFGCHGDGCAGDGVVVCRTTTLSLCVLLIGHESVVGGLCQILHHWK